MAAIDPSIDAILGYCGFDNEVSRFAIARDGFGSFADIGPLDSKDIDKLADGFAARRQTDGKIIFGLKRTSNLKAAVDFTKDFGRISREPSLDGIDDENSFHLLIEEARERSKMRKHKLADSKELSTAASPGKLKKDWIQWEEAFTNYLSTILGQNGVPLSYVTRENEEPDYTEEEEGDFEMLSIACNPVTGPGFKTDARKVHQLLFGFVQGEIAATWLKDNKKKQDGRLDMKALRAHYSGAGHKSLQIKEAETLRRNLLYKNERVLTFEQFLTKMQAMFLGYSDHGEAFLETQKIRMLFEKIQHPLLTTTKSSLQVSYNLDPEGGSVDYNFIANSFSAEVASLPDFSARQASGVESHVKEDNSPTTGIHGANGKIFTGFYPNFRELPWDDRKAIFEERTRLNIVPKDRKRGGVRGRGARAGAARNASAASTKQSKGTKKAMANLTKQISALKVRVTDAEKKRSHDDDDDEVSDSAGNAFGGRNSKKSKH
jgi:hypothetical protein